jgi:hypothetical protein
LATGAVTLRSAHVQLPEKIPRLKTWENTNVVNAWHPAFCCEGVHRFACRNGTQDMHLLCGRCARRDLPDVRTYSGTGVLRFRTSADQKLCVDTPYSAVRFNRLMHHMADRAGVGRRVDMMMPDASNRHSYNQRDNRYWQDQVPDSLLIRHFLKSFSKLKHT